MLGLLSECSEKSTAHYAEMRHHKRERITMVVKDSNVDEFNSKN